MLMLRTGTSKLLTDELVIRTMRTDPEPMYPAWHGEAQRPVVEADSDAMKPAVSNGLEMQRRMIGIDFDLREIPVRVGLNFGGQSVKALPKAP